MTLYDACDIGYAMGMDTIGECLSNIQFHATNIYNYDDIPIELDELFKEFNQSGLKEHDSVEVILGKEKMKEIDECLEDAIFGSHAI